MKRRYTIATLFVVFALMSSCYKNIADYPYPDQAIYLPAALGGNYVINSLATPGLNYRYVVDQSNSKLIIPLSVFRSGINSSGEVNVAIMAKTDTVNSLITAGSLTNTTILPANKFTLPASAILPSGAESKDFSLEIDLNYLLTNPIGNYAIAVSISSNTVKTTAKNVAIIVINPAFLTPISNFSYTIDPSTARKVNFTNSSSNSLSYSWNFGDGSIPVTDTSPFHIYATSGTYTVILTCKGAAGGLNPVSKMLTVTVP